MSELFIVGLDLKMTPTDFVSLLQKVEELKAPDLEDLNSLDVRDIFLSLLGAIAKAAELRDEYTSHHQSNVAILSVAIGKCMNLTPNQLFGLHVGALVHDIGKIAVPAEILNKTSKLNTAEIAMMRLHPSFGAKIFEDVKTPWPIVDMIEQHHERMDGTGYPQKLRGDQIILEARIIAVADTFDAMAGDRPYRKAPGIEAALGVIREGSGQTYDADVVTAFLEALDQGILSDPNLFGGWAA